MAQDNFFSGRPQIVEPLAWEESTTCFFLSLKDKYLTYFPAPTFTTEYLTMTTVNYFQSHSSRLNPLGLEKSGTREGNKVISIIPVESTQEKEFLLALPEFSTWVHDD